MRVWSLHPRYLDPVGLVALWRETLLARKVLCGQTRGYRQHPQLQRFQAQADPIAAVDVYLQAVHDEARARGYRFDPAKFDAAARSAPISVTVGQRDYEWRHLCAKLQLRNPDLLARWNAVTAPDLHPLFDLVPGAVAAWEKHLPPSESSAHRRPTP